MTVLHAAASGIVRGLSGWHPASMPVLSRIHYRRELSAWLFLSVLIGAIEGGVVGVIAKTGFEGVVPTRTLNFAVAILASAPAFANVTSFIWVGVSRGRDKVRMLVTLQLMAVLLVAQVVFAPRSVVGLGMLMLASVGGRMCWAGVVTLRATVWRANYPRHTRPTMAGRLATIQAAMLSLTALSMALALRANEESFRVVYGIAAASGVVGALFYLRMRVRRHRAMLEAERRDDAERAAGGVRLAGPRALLRVLTEDRAYRNYMATMFVFGIGNLSVGSLVIIVLRDVFGYGYLRGILVAAIIPTTIMMPAIPFWSRLLDRMHILQFRSIHAWSFVSAAACFTAGAALQLEWLMWAGAVCKGIGIGGGVLGWNLGHHDFAPPDKTSDYMAVHVTLTGVRGMIGPVLAVGLYELLEATPPEAVDQAAIAAAPDLIPGGGAWVFGLCLALTLFGAALFMVQRRMGTALTD
ncbi:MAG: MFS transporter [Phycisphaerales bacterium]